jgi:hypothetical protein
MPVGIPELLKTKGKEVKKALYSVFQKRERVQVLKS